ncbi:MULTISPECIES: HD domain-containing protein [unclassified Thermotoga]|uniref:HD domain-containing protein n=1 Tax=unclassified Thermotoga TaxID=2631113 RepID=UPI000540A162|nr:MULTISPECIES: HD domain-containing protein [unclassified Thermotoga]AIY88221.1 metal dependent phosphohydrolase [Thermotoga sp. Cell2]KHC90808.1 metal dependent phosphohydrolase [Thermotoga sp. TBGT1765]KHC91654.1 metal dependent phosphohydrolase [Thermotoga sp. TBGT1766]KHC96817.1 metal dependent phosphohydrolase [Thermotoga sp. Xyl54]
MIQMLINLLKTIPSLGRHSFQVAFLSAQIAEKMNLDSNVSFLSGLIHDLGLILPYEGKTLLDEIDDTFVIVRDTPGKPLHLHSILGSFITDYVEKLKPISPIVLKHHFPASYLDKTEENLISNIVFISDQVSRYTMVNLDVSPRDILIALEDMKSFFFPEVFEACREVLNMEFVQWQLENILAGYDVTDLLNDHVRNCPDCDKKDLIQIGKIVSFIVDTKSEFTTSHTWRVAVFSKKMAEKAGRNSEDLFIAGLYHDIGKISVSYKILEKPAKLSDEEYAIMKKHVYFSYLILLPYKDENWFLPAVRHHERLDGYGYPFRLKGEEMTLEDKIIQVADVFSALLEERSYRPANTVEKALSMVREEVKKKKLSQEAFELLESSLEDFDLSSIEVGREIRKEIRTFVNRVVEKFGDYVL